MDSSIYITLLKVKLFKGVVSRLACSKTVDFLLKVRRARDKNKNSRELNDRLRMRYGT